MKKDRRWSLLSRVQLNGNPINEKDGEKKKRGRQLDELMADEEL
jgi:hypothetical protein